MKRKSAKYKRAYIPEKDYQEIRSLANNLCINFSAAYEIWKRKFKWKEI